MARREKRVAKSDEAGRTAQVALVTVQNSATRGSRDETTKTKKVYTCISPRVIYSPDYREEIPKSKGDCSVNTAVPLYRSLKATGRKEKHQRRMGQMTQIPFPTFPCPSFYFFFVKILLVPSRFCSFLSLSNSQLLASLVCGTYSREKTLGGCCLFCTTLSALWVVGGRVGCVCLVLSVLGLHIFHFLAIFLCPLQPHS